MKTLKMNARLLSIIGTVQTAKDLFIKETSLYERDHAEKSVDGCLCYSDRMHSNDVYVSRTRNYFFELDNALIDSAGLVKNEDCFDAICRYKITPDMGRTKFEHLGQYSFSY